jgi:hypothetical protein
VGVVEVLSRSPHAVVSSCLLVVQSLGRCLITFGGAKFHQPMALFSPAAMLGFAPLHNSIN